MAHVRSYAPARPCESCGQSFRPRRDGLAKGRGRFCSQRCTNALRAKPLDAPVSEAIRLYSDEKMSLQAVADRLGSTPRRVSAALRAAGVELRPGGWRPTTSYRTVYAPDGRRLREHQVNVRNLQPGQVVHHIDLDRMNNDPSNLVGLTRREHAKAHYQLQTLAASLVRAGLIEWDGAAYVLSSRMGEVLRDG